MTHRFLLDTNVLSEPLRKEPDPAVMAALEAHGDEVATASVVWHELQFGAQRLPRSKKRSVLEEYLDEVVARTMSILSYDTAAAGWHAAERAQLSKAGLLPSFADGQIAAIAVTNDLTLVTRNLRDFQCFSSLSVESWHTHPPGDKQELLGR